MLNGFESKSVSSPIPVTLWENPHRQFQLGTGKPRCSEKIHMYNFNHALGKPSALL